MQKKLDQLSAVLFSQQGSMELSGYVSCEKEIVIDPDHPLCMNIVNILLPPFILISFIFPFLFLFFYSFYFPLLNQSKDSGLHATRRNFYYSVFFEK